MRLDFLAALSGVMIALQARANGELSHRLDNGLQAALVSFSSGLLIILIITPFSPHIKEGIRNLKAAITHKEIARWKLLAGALGGSFVAIQTQIVPLIGVAIYSVASIAGQTAMSLVVDRIGLTGGGKKLISPRRVMAAVLTVVAVLVSVWDRIDADNLSMIAVTAGCIAGAVVGVQRALNGQINNVLAFPGIFRGLLDANAHKISDQMLVAAAEAIADCVSPDQLNTSFIVPSVFDPNVVKAVAAAVKKSV